MSPLNAKAARSRKLPAIVPAIIDSSAALANVFAALGDPTRLKIVAALCSGGAYSIAQLTASTEISRQGVTKHLHVLAGAGVVRECASGLHGGEWAGGGAGGKAYKR